LLHVALASMRSSRLRSQRSFHTPPSIVNLSFKRMFIRADLSRICIRLVGRSAKIAGPKKIVRRKVYVPGIWRKPAVRKQHLRTNEYIIWKETSRTQNLSFLVSENATILIYNKTIHSSIYYYVAFVHLSSRKVGPHAGTPNISWIHLF